MKLKLQKKNIKIALARDEAFCFYYEDSLNLLRELGAELIEFSPLYDENLPDDVSGLYIGGGYPELYMEKLSGNIAMIESLKKNTIWTTSHCRVRRLHVSFKNI